MTEMLSYIGKAFPSYISLNTSAGSILTTVTTIQKCLFHLTYTRLKIKYILYQNIIYHHIKLFNLHFPKAGSSGHFLFRSYSFPFSIPFMSLSKNSILIIYLIILIIFLVYIEVVSCSTILKTLK